MKASPFFSGVGREIDEVPYYNGFRFEHEGSEVLVSRTGYTGELGFEVFVEPRLAPLVWQQLSEAGAPHGLMPIGLGARDTLRFEAAYCLYGHELDDETSPLEAGLGWVVKLKKENFRGAETLRRQKKEGPPRTLVWFELDGRNIARQGYAVLKDGAEVGKITSGAFSPTMKKSLCMASIDREAKIEGAEYHVVIRNKEARAALTPLPFYKSRAK